MGNINLISLAECQLKRQEMESIVAGESCGCGCGCSCGEGSNMDGLANSNNSGPQDSDYVSRIFWVVDQMQREIMEIIEGWIWTRVNFCLMP